MISGADERLTPWIRVQTGVGEEAYQAACRERFIERILIRTRLEAAASDARGRIGTSYDRVIDAALERSEGRDDCMRPLGYGHQAGALFVALPGFSVAALTLLRAKQDGPFATGTSGLLTLLTPYVRQALEFRLRLSRARDAALLNEEVSARTGFSYLWLDEAGMVLGCTAGADRMLDACPELLIESGRLRAKDPCEDTALQTCIAGVLVRALCVRKTPGNPGAEAAVLIGHRRRSGPLRITIAHSPAR